MINFINEHFDWFESMQKGLGHDSWWYTNRRPDDCINVKLHSWVDVAKITDQLTDQEKTTIQTLGIDLNKLCNDLVWEDFGMVDDARRCLLEDLKFHHNVKDLEYGGRSGGWLAVVYDWAEVYDDYDNPEYNYKEVLAFYRTIKNAIKEHKKVTTLVLERKRQLEKDIENPANYIEVVRDTIAYKLEEAQPII